VFLVALLAIAGTVAMIYGSVQMFRLSAAGLAADGADVSIRLQLFTKCSELEGPSGGAWDSNVINHAVRAQCMMQQMPYKLAMGFAGGFMILAVLCIPCAFKKDKMFGFTMWSTLAIATIIMSVVVVSTVTLPTISHFAMDCSKYDANTIQELSSLGVTCLKGVEGVPNKITALKWLCKVHTFYAGAALSIVSLLLLFMCKHCCCCNPNASCCSSQAAGAGAGCGAGANADNCPIRRAVNNFKARFCSRRCGRSQAMADSADSALPVSAPSYYQVHESTPEGAEASEDAGVNPPSPSRNYYGVN
jgi:hypothetical protein